MLGNANTKELWTVCDIEMHLWVNTYLLRYIIKHWSGLVRAPCVCQSSLVCPCLHCSMHITWLLVRCRKCLSHGWFCLQVCCGGFSINTVANWNAKKSRAAESSWMLGLASSHAEVHLEGNDRLKMQASIKHETGDNNRRRSDWSFLRSISYSCRMQWMSSGYGNLQLLREKSIVKTA